MAIKKLSNSFSTGNGGGNFEQRIQALFLLSLLIDGFCPAMNQKTKCIYFQAKHNGYDVDDLVVVTDGGNGQLEGRLHCQVKHRITISENDKTFQEVIEAAWSDFKKDGFNIARDRIALATSQMAVQSIQALRFLNDQASHSTDEKDFFERIRQSRFTNQTTRSVLSTIKNCIQRENDGEVTDLELWEFCKIFVLLLFDLDYAYSINRILTESLIKCNSDFGADQVWSSLVSYAGECNQNAATINCENIQDKIRALFKGKARGELERQEQIFLRPVAEIDTFISTLALIGSWREDNMRDRQIVKNISGMDYEVFVAKARNLLSQGSDYLEVSNGVWTVCHKETLLEYSIRCIFDDVILRLFEAASDIFGQKSKSVETANKTMHFITVTEEYDNSREIRKSISDSMCWIKKSLPNLLCCNVDKIENKICCFVNGLLDGAEWTVWASLKDCLQNIAELAPRIFLEKLEECILKKPQEILQLFPQRGNGIFGQSNYIANMLWAIECLAWSPDYLIPAIRTLGMLEALPYQRSNWANTPLNSIVSILIPWHPNTLANSEKQKSALKCLSNESESVSWNVIFKLFPNQTTVTTSTPRPRYLNLTIPEKIEVSQDEIDEQYQFILTLAVDAAQDRVERMADLAGEIQYMSESLLAKYLTGVENIAKHSTESEMFQIWIKLDENVERMEGDLEPNICKYRQKIEQIIETISPKEPFLRYQKLYLRRHFQKDDSVDAWTAWQMQEEEKRKAIKELYDRYGLKKVEKFGHEVEHLSDVANKLGSSLGTEEVSALIDNYIAGEVKKEFFESCIDGFVRVQGPERLLDTSLSQCSSESALNILSNIVFSKGLYDVVQQLLPDDSKYWMQVRMPYVCGPELNDEMPLIVDKLVKAQRYVTAINRISRSCISDSKCRTEISVADLRQLLRLAGTEESIGVESIDSYAVAHLIGILQEQDDIDLEEQSEIEFIYLPILDDSSEVKPRALNARLGTDPDYFCGMVELFYKRESDESFDHELNEGLQQRLSEVLFPFKAVPGIGWDSEFKEDVFRRWIDTVKDWSKSNDRFTVTMHTVGTGLSYAPLDSEECPAREIVWELNKAENEELRRGYYMGIVNQRGVYMVDSEGKPELRLEEIYNDRAEKAEQEGFSRYSELLRDIAKGYRREAEYNRRLMHRRQEDE